jgi:endonuclease YncB( thermonuclease family)
MRRVWRVLAVVLLLIGIHCPSSAAQRRAWFTLTDCQYVSAKDNDGDSFRVHCGDKEFGLRLYFVDAPEPNLRYAERTREQSEYFGVTLDETMKAGVEAAAVVRATLQKPFVVRTRWATAGGRGRETRYLGWVEVGSERLAELLVSRGLARIKGVYVKLPTGETVRAYLERLEGLEGEAREKRVGIWANAGKKGSEPQTR